jgi:two-component system response regulator RegA
MSGRSPQAAEDERSTLLLVDDDDAFRRVLARALDRRGYAVSVAATAATAIVKAQAQSPEYAVVDLRMPGQSGLC